MQILTKKVIKSPHEHVTNFKNIIKSPHEYVCQAQKKQQWYHSFQYWELKLRSEEEISIVTNWFEIQNLKNNRIKSTHEHVYQGKKTIMMCEFHILRKWLRNEEQLSIEANIFEMHISTNKVIKRTRTLWKNVKIDPQKYVYQGFPPIMAIKTPNNE